MRTSSKKIHGCISIITDFQYQGRGINVGDGVSVAVGGLGVGVDVGRGVLVGRPKVGDSAVEVSVNVGDGVCVGVFEMVRMVVGTTGAGVFHDDVEICGEATKPR